MAEKKVDEYDAIDIVESVLQKIVEEESNMWVSELDSFVEHRYGDWSDWVKDAHESHSEEVTTETNLDVETDLTDDEIEKAISWYERKKKSQKENPGGRPSKTKKWAQRINSGDATLEDAKEELPESTFYKLKREFDLE